MGSKSDVVKILGPHVLNEISHSHLRSRSWLWSRSWSHVGSQCRCVCFVVTGYFSFRGRHGTVFVSALCDMLRQYRATHDLVHILTRVNYEVAYFFESLVNRENPDHMILSHKKQMPTFVSMLTKDLYFVPKQLVQKKHGTSK